MRKTIVNPIIKDSVTFVKASAETNGTLTELQLTLMPKGGNPMHYHKTFTETFTAIEGNLGIKLGKSENKILKPGDSYTVPIEQLHCFYNPGEKEIKFKIEIKPGSQAFENGLRIIYGIAEDGLVDKKGNPKNFTHLAIFLTISDINVRGLLSLMTPVFKYIAAKAEKKGTQKQLIEKYCR